MYLTLHTTYLYLPSLPVYLFGDRRGLLSTRSTHTSHTSLHLTFPHAFPLRMLCLHCPCTHTSACLHTFPPWQAGTDRTSSREGRGEEGRRRRKEEGESLLLIFHSMSLLSRGSCLTCMRAVGLFTRSLPCLAMHSACYHTYNLSSAPQEEEENGGGERRRSFTRALHFFPLKRAFTALHAFCLAFAAPSQAPSPILSQEGSLEHSHLFFPIYWLVLVGLPDRTTTHISALLDITTISCVASTLICGMGQCLF